jgi:GDPmannose 4,6-dehydratase
MTDNRKTALIFGISGQDGAYLAKLLLDRDYAVHGTSRDAEISGFASLASLGIKGHITLHSAVPTDFRSAFQVISRTLPDEIYNLSGQSSVGLSFQQPVETLESITVGTLNILECIRLLGRPIRFYNAGSGECFGDTGGTPATESTPFHPRSPYAVAKSAAFWEVANYRDSYDLYACSGILFNHESPLRPQRTTGAGRSFNTTRLGMGAGICGSHVGHAPARETRGYRYRNRRYALPGRTCGYRIHRARSELARSRAHGFQPVPPFRDP